MPVYQGTFATADTFSLWGAYHYAKQPHASFIAYFERMSNKKAPVKGLG
jgi:hypothetical protein